MPAKRKYEEARVLAGYSPPLLRPRGKIRWLFFVFLNLAIYTMACGLWQIIGSGTGELFWQSTLRGNLLFEIKQLCPLSDRVSAITNPWMPVILAALLALIVVVPVAMSVLYQLVLALLFVVVCAVVGMSPEIAVILVVACLLSSRTRLRREYPFYAILFGMIPVAAYLLIVYLFCRARFELLPLRRWILLIPFALSVILAAGTAFMVVLMARMAKFRPGALWPSALLLFSAAAGLFYTYVGIDELLYAQIRAAAQEDLVLVDTAGGGASAAPDKELEDRIARITKRCTRFLDRYGQSERAPSVAWIRARTASTQINRREPDGGFLRCSHEWPLIRSSKALRLLVGSYPDSDQAGLARGRLGIIELKRIREFAGAQRRAKLNLACEMLQEAEESLATTVENVPLDKNVGNGTIFVPIPPVPDKKDSYAGFLFTVKRLNWLIDRNDVLSDPVAAEALAEWLAVNPCGNDYLVRLESLKNTPKYRDSKIGANIAVAWANNLDVFIRTRHLLAIAAGETNDVDAAVEANYELGIIAMREAEKPWLTALLGKKSAIDFLEKVTAAPENPWQKPAAETMSRLRSPGDVTADGTGK